MTSPIPHEPPAPLDGFGAPPREIRAAVRWATRALGAAGIASAPVDALLLAAHVLGVDPGEARRLLVLGGIDLPDRYAGLVTERADRVPLQHLTGRAHFRSLTLAVGPGVFIPRPETETLAIKAECPAARVYAVEIDPLAHGWAVANRDRLGLDVEVQLGDACTAYPQLWGSAAVVTCNPPYIPDGQVPIDPEVRDHDPELALYGRSADGLAVPRVMAAAAARLLRPGGRLFMEHAETQGPGLLRALAGAGCWTGAQDHPDLTGRPRVSAAIRGDAPVRTDLGSPS